MGMFCIYILIYWFCISCYCTFGPFFWLFVWVCLWFVPHPAFSGFRDDTVTLRFSYFTDAAQHPSVTVILMEMPLSAAVAILGHARAAMEARPIGETWRTMVFYFSHIQFILYNFPLLYFRRHLKYTSCNDNHGIRPPPPEQYLTPLQQKEVCIRHLRARLKETVERLQNRYGMRRFQMLCS